MHGIHRNEKIPRSLYVVAMEGDAPEITLFYQWQVLEIVTMTRVLAFSLPLFNAFTFFNPFIF